MAPKKCEVCEDAQSKYKCPACLIAYCSLPCFKKHKEISCQKGKSLKEEKAFPSSTTNDDKPSYVDQQSKLLEESQLQSVVPSSTLNDDKPSSVDKHSKVLEEPQLQPIVPSSSTNDDKPSYVDEQSEVLEESQLQSVASCNEIRSLLKNEKLQKLVLGIDSSADPESELDKAMEDESFRLFTEKILSTIDK